MSATVIRNPADLGALIRDRRLGLDLGQAELDSRIGVTMKIGDTDRLHDIGLPEWRELAAQVRTDGDTLVGRIRAITAELPDLLSDEMQKMNDAGCSGAVIDRLAPTLVERAKRIARQ